MTPNIPKLCHWILRNLVLLIPKPERADWLMEWESELAFAGDEWRKRGLTDHAVWRKQLKFCLGAAPDAYSLAFFSDAPAAMGSRLSRSARVCLAILAAGVVAELIVTSGLATTRAGILPRPTPMYIIAFEIALFAVVLRTALMWTSGRPYPIRFCLFYLVKTALLQVLITIAAIEFLPAASYGYWRFVVEVFNIIGTMVISGLAIVWSIHDQLFRCRCCLDRLGHPVRIGDLSHAFLAYAGTESICEHGHGILYVPEASVTEALPEKWTPLDESWTELFVAGGR